MPTATLHVTDATYVDARDSVNHSGDTWIWVHFADGTHPRFRPLWKFDLVAAGIPQNAIIDSAIFSSRVQSLDNWAAGSDTFDGNPEPMRLPWTQAGATWANTFGIDEIEAADGGLWGKQLQILTSVGQIVDWDIKPLVNWWLKSPANNFGMTLADRSPGNAKAVRLDDEAGTFPPTLVINYRIGTASDLPPTDLDIALLPFSGEMLYAHPFDRPAVYTDTEDNFAKANIDYMVLAGQKIFYIADKFAIANVVKNTAAFLYAKSKGMRTELGYSSDNLTGALPAAIDPAFTEAAARTFGQNLATTYPISVVDVFVCDGEDNADGGPPGAEHGQSTGSNTATIFNDTSKSWTLNQWAGWLLGISEGPGAGQETPVTSNTTGGQITHTAWGGTTPTNASKYYLINPKHNAVEMCKRVKAQSQGVQDITPGRETRYSQLGGTGQTFEDYIAAGVAVVTDFFTYVTGSGCGHQEVGAFPDIATETLKFRTFLRGALKLRALPGGSRLKLRGEALTQVPWVTFPAPQTGKVAQGKIIVNNGIRHQAVTYTDRDDYKLLDNVDFATQPGGRYELLSQDMTTLYPGFFSKQYLALYLAMNQFQVCSLGMSSGVSCIMKYAFRTADGNKLAIAYRRPMTPTDTWDAGITTSLIVPDYGLTPKRVVDLGQASVLESPGFITAGGLTTIPNLNAQDYFKLLILERDIPLPPPVVIVPPNLYKTLGPGYSIFPAKFPVVPRRY